jgi:hypothetical protein
MSIQLQDTPIEYVYPRVLNWAQIMRDIADNGLTYSSVSKTLGVGWSTVSRWRTGSEPQHSIGCAILLLHAKYCGQDLTRQRVSEGEQ